MIQADQRSIAACGGVGIAYVTVGGKPVYFIDMKSAIFSLIPPLLIHPILVSTHPHSALP